MAAYIIEPLTGCDHAAKDLVMDLRYVIDGLLDPERMLDSLYDLIDKKWQHLGARLRRKLSGQYELHIPRFFGDDSPPALFGAYDADKSTPVSACFNRLPDVRQDDYRQRITSFRAFMFKTPIADSLLRLRPPQSQRARQCASSKFGPIRLNLDDLCRSSGPLLTVLLYRFPESNETVLRVCCPHITFDANALGDFIRAWSSVVTQGHVDAIPPLLSVRHMPRSTLSLSHAKASSYGEKDAKSALDSSKSHRWHVMDIIPSWNPFNGLLSFLWRSLMVRLMRLRAPRQFRRIALWVPQKQLDVWRDEAMQHRPAHLPNSSFLSDNNLLVSWTIWEMSQTRSSWLDGVFGVSLPVNTRPLDPHLAKALQIDEKETSKSRALQRAGKVALHNLIGTLTLKDQWWASVSRGNKWDLAWRLHEMVVTIRAPGGRRALVESTAAKHCMEYQVDGEPVLAEGAQTARPCLPPHSESFRTTNWLQSGVMEAANFEAAVEKTSEAASGSSGRATEMWMPSESLELDPSKPLNSFPGVMLYSKKPLQGIMAAINIDEGLIRQGHFGRTLDFEFKS